MGQNRFYIPEYNASGMADENMSAETLAAIKRMVEIAYKGLNSTKPPVSRSATVYAVTGTFHGSLVEACSEGEARRIFHKCYNGESILSVIKRGYAGR